MASTTGGPRARWARLWAWYLSGGAVLAVVYAVTPPGPSKLVVWPIIGWSSVIAILVGVRVNRPQARSAWYLLAGGVVTFIVGDDLYSFRNWVQHAKALFPSYVDGVYLAMYPLLIAGLVILVRRRTPRGDRGSVIDAAVITAGLGLLSWVVLVSPYVSGSGMSLLERLVSIAYPLGDVALLAVVARLAVGGGRRPLAFWLLFVSLFGLLAADALYGWLNIAGGWHEHHPIDAGWIAFYVGWGAAALHPSMRSLSEPAAAPRRVTRGRVALVGGAALIPPAVLAVEAARGRVDDALAISITAAVLFALVLARTAGLAREVAASHGEARFRSLVQNSLDAIVVVDDAGRVVYQTPSAAPVLGCSAERLDGARLADLMHPVDAGLVDALLTAPSDVVVSEWRLGEGDDVRHLEAVVADLRTDASVGGVVVTMRDTTERKKLEDELRHQALHDRLTGLANRTLFLDRVHRALAMLDRRGDGVGVLFLDVDDFKVVNDALGHHVGDDLLVAVAERLRTAVRPSDTVARLGGDEFAILVEDGRMPAAADAVAGRVREVLEAPVVVAGEGVRVAVSIGIAFGTRGQDAGDLLREADMAMYLAKRAGKGRTARLDTEGQEDAKRRIEIAHDLPGAVARRELHVVFQPIFDLATGTTLGAEALVRWNHPRLGAIPPLDFIAIAEESRVIVDLGRWVLDEACAQVRAWRDAGSGAYVSVNLSAVQLDDPFVARDVADALHRHRLPAEALMLEVTETALMRNVTVARDRLDELKRLGVRLAVDDFGTGYSSLSYLSDFPFGVLKIDKSFIDRLGDEDGAAMVRAVLSLSQSLGMATVAEGIEESGQARLLEALGCGMGQGYLYAKPMPAAEVFERVVGRVAVAS